METRKIYVKEDFKIKKYNCLLMDKKIKFLLKQCEVKSQNLYHILNVLLETKSTKHFSYVVNTLTEYKCLNDNEKYLKEEIINCIFLDSECKNISLEKYILNFLYNEDLTSAEYYFEDELKNQKIINLPFSNVLNKK